MALSDMQTRIIESLNKTGENVFNYYFQFFDFLKKYLFSFKIAIFVVDGFIHFYYPIRWLEYGLIPGLFEMLFFYILINFVFSFFQFSILYMYKKKNNLAFDSVDNFTLGVGRISFLLNIVIFIFVLLYLFEVDIMGFLTTLALFAVAIVIMFKDYISNIINGTIVMFSKDISMKDYVKIGDYKGRVTDITFMNVKLKTDEGDVVFVPNGNVLSKEVTNFSKTSNKKIKYEFSVSKDNASKIRNFEDYISRKLCEEYENLITDENISLKILKVDKDSIYLLLEIIVNKYNFKIEDQIKRSASYIIIDFIDKKLSGDRKLVVK